MMNALTRDISGTKSLKFSTLASEMRHLKRRMKLFFQILTDNSLTLIQCRSEL